MKPTLLFCNLFWVLFSVITCVVAYRLKLGSLGKKKAEEEKRNTAGLSKN